jgi:hypothetical protein
MEIFSRTVLLDLFQILDDRLPVCIFYLILGIYAFAFLVARECVILDMDIHANVDYTLH